MRRWGQPMTVYISDMILLQLCWLCASSYTTPRACLPCLKQRGGGCGGLHLCAVGFGRLFARPVAGEYLLLELEVVLVDGRLGAVLDDEERGGRDLVCSVCVCGEWRCMTLLQMLREG